MHLRSAACLPAPQIWLRLSEHHLFESETTLKQKFVISRSKFSLSHRPKATMTPGSPTEPPQVESYGAFTGQYRYIEFKYLYFQIQQHINKDVILSFRYEQLKTPELRVSLIKPLVTKIVELSNTQSLIAAFSNQLATTPGSVAFETPQFGPVGYGTHISADQSPGRISPCVIYVLLLLKYEYMIQSENHLIMYDLLTTKATICEFLAIRMLREYSSTERINLLFINPMAHHLQHTQLKNTKHLDNFNTLELSILSKSKKFLVQPVIVGILDRIYNGELIMKEKKTRNTHSSVSKPESSKLMSRHNEESYLTAKNWSRPDLESGDSDTRASTDPGSVNYDNNIVNYKFNQITIKKVIVRSNIVPKYQSLVINLKYGFLTLLFLVLVFKHKYNHSPAYLGSSPAFSIVFWIVALSFNFDVIVKSLQIEFRFLKKIIWTYIDILIVVLIDISFVMRLLLEVGKIEGQTYYNCFSLISILLFPRMLSVFNNYEFFNMIIVSLKKMTWNVIAMSCLFTSLIFGFFLCFISLTIDMSTYDVAFAMVKLFFGFTPAVWDNWESYDNLGRGLQLAYLSLIQFVFATILAIVLSNVFAKVSETNKEEFEYLKTTNLIIYLKWASFRQPGSEENGLTIAFDYIVKLSKFPIILVIYFYEILIKENKKLLQKQRKDLKHFTFLSHEHDLFGDHNMILLSQLAEEDEIASLRLTSRRGSQVDPRVASDGARTHRFATDPNFNAHAATLQRNLVSKRLIPQQSQGTMAGFRSGSLDSMFIDDFLGKRYGNGKLRNTSELRNKRVKSGTGAENKVEKSNEQLISKMKELQDMIEQLVRARSAVEPSQQNDYAVRAYVRKNSTSDSIAISGADNDKDESCESSGNSDCEISDIDGH
ncbi:hypothetical protein OXX80_000774 [Metschnikowia pulcherrima]